MTQKRISVGVPVSVGETPDLFSDIKKTSQPVGRRPARSPQSSGVIETSAYSATSVSATGAGRVDHLAAARKLQWQIRKVRAHSPEEVKTGRLICRHLLALLNEAGVHPPGTAGAPGTEPANHSPARQRA